MGMRRVLSLAAGLFLLTGCGAPKNHHYVSIRAVETVPTTTTTTTIPPTTTTTVPPTTVPVTTATTAKVVHKSFTPAPGLNAPFWVALRGCECSNGHCNGKYRGYYQFTYSSWASAGGTGDPEAASLDEQHSRAVYWSHHTDPYTQWPVCWPRAKAQTGG